MITSIEQITDELLRNGLLDDESLGESCHAMEKRGDAITGPNLLALLTSEGKLTPFQADEVRSGRANQLLLGNYIVLSKLGEGGMGTVYKALHRRMQRVVAIKVIKKEVATREFITRFRREIQLSARLNHPNVVTAYDADQCPMGDFLVMEYVEGTDLNEVMKRNGPLPVQDAVSAIRQAALALGYAHQRGIVHRDIKPANLLRDVNGCVKVVDLGLARVSKWEGASGTDLTQLGAVAGTVDYMSPEQADDPLSVDSRSDIYSLGCTLFYLLTSTPVFTKSSLVGRLIAHRSAPPPRLAVVRTEVPVELDDIFQKMVAKSPADRFATMEAIVEALDGLSQAQADAQAVASPSQSEQVWSPSKSTVVIVEESLLQSGMIGKLLKDQGVAEVQSFQTGEEAMQRIPSLVPAVILCSHRLPDMSGLEFASRVRDTFRWLRSGIVLMSSDDWTTSRSSAAEQLGRLRVIKKPFDAVGLRQSIEEALQDDRDQQPIRGLSELKVLIVDDSSLARRHEQDTLQSLGFSQFTHADDGDVAAELVQQSRFDLVITDYHMPRMDGRTLTEYIRQHSNCPDLPIIMVTTEFSPQVLAPVYQLGVSAICNKNFDREMVRNIVIQLFA